VVELESVEVIIGQSDVEYQIYSEYSEYSINIEIIDSFELG